MHIRANGKALPPPPRIRFEHDCLQLPSAQLLKYLFFTSKWPAGLSEVI
jgi:hypothetical protein